jgi:hypothetical protein
LRRLTTHFAEQLNINKQQKNNMPTTYISPIQAAREAMRRFDYGGAHQVLVDAVKQNPQRMDLARIANLISPCGMFAEAIDALNRLEGSIEEYQANKPEDEDISCPLNIHQAMPATA